VFKSCNRVKSISNRISVAVLFDICKELSHRIVM